MPFDYEQFYSPWARRRRAAAASPENPATTGVPNPARSDPYPRYDPDAPAKRALGAVAYGEMSGREPQTAAELEEASGVDRRIPDAPNSFGPVRRGAAGSRLVEGTGGAYGYTNGSVDGLYRYGTRTTPAAGGLAGALLSSDRGGVSPEEAARLARLPYVGNRNDSYYEQSYGTAAAEDAIARGRLKVPTLAQTELGRAEAAGAAAARDYASLPNGGAEADAALNRSYVADIYRDELRPLVEEQQARIFGRRQEYLGERAGDNSLAYHERLGLGAMRSAEAEEAARRRREAEAARLADAELAAQTERARIAAGVPVVGPGGVAAVPNGEGGWTVDRPPVAAPPAPAPVSFGGGAGAIPEIGADGQPTGRYVYQAPPTPSADTDRPVALGGGGMGVKDPKTGEWTIQVPPKQGEKGARAVTLKPGESYYDPETKETFVAPGADRQSIEAEIANLTAALGKADGPKQIDAIEKQLTDARARLAALAASAAAPAPVAPAEPAPAPAALAEQPPPADPWAAFGGLYTGK